MGQPGQRCQDRGLAPSGTDHGDCFGVGMGEGRGSSREWSRQENRKMCEGFGVAYRIDFTHEIGTKETLLVI